MHLRFLTYAASAAFFACVGHSQSCLTDGSAASFPTVFGSIRREVEGYEELIDKFISPNFQFVSDSVAFLTGGTLNDTNAHSMEEYLASYADHLPPPTSSRLIHTAHSCDTITTYSEFIVGGVPIRAFNLYFVDLPSAKIVKLYTEINNGAARYAICKLNLTACPTQAKFDVGKNGPASGFSGCQAPL
ncbi:uncharacterized protein RHO25_007748 [Cercospora beticola]|uniref:NTF2-like domain-containing protein n=2 Tax=Cercospora beticola TaxID=122368 RepID=A0ABZ0NUD9_CERBT|nr:hypothetical protein RHO25_007748 [Cercospora beticola]